jgi:hypothetical protein
MWSVYIVRCADDSLYVGETNDLDLRLLSHNEGGHLHSPPADGLSCSRTRSSAYHARRP